MKNPGVIALRAVEDALAVVGTHETAEDNHGPEVRQYLESVGLPEGNPWCMAFVIFRLKKAAAGLKVDLPPIPFTGYTPAFANWGKTHNLWIPNNLSGHSQVKRGDLVFFYSSGIGRIHHVGIVTGIRPDGVDTVEGNTSGGPGVDANGGGVFRKTRDWSDIGSQGGFVRLPW